MILHFHNLNSAIFFFTLNHALVFSAFLKYSQLGLGMWIWGCGCIYSTVGRVWPGMQEALGLTCH